MSLKKFLRKCFKSFLALAGLAWLFPGFEVRGDGGSLIVGSIMLTAINILVRPILKLILLPLNLVSFGMFGWVINVLSLLLLTIIVENIRFVPYKFPGVSKYGFAVPPVSFSVLGSLIAGSFLLTILRKIIYWFLSSDGK